MSRQNSKLQQSTIIESLLDFFTFVSVLQPHTENHQMSQVIKSQKRYFLKLKLIFTILNRLF